MDCVERKRTHFFSLKKGVGSVLNGVGSVFAEFVEMAVFDVISIFILHFGDGRIAGDNENALLSLGNRVNWVIRVH